MELTDKIIIAKIDTASGEATYSSITLADFLASTAFVDAVEAITT
jgi:hypothetical protein